MNTFQLIFLFIAFYDIFFLCLYYRPVDRELSRNFVVDRSRRQRGHPWYRSYIWFNKKCLQQLHWSYQKKYVYIYI